VFYGCPMFQVGAKEEEEEEEEEDVNFTAFTN
jgi:hypothetical protein